MYYVLAFTPSFTGTKLLLCYSKTLLQGIASSISLYKGTVKKPQELCKRRDIPATLDDTIAIAALCQALVAKLDWLYRHSLSTPIIFSHFIEENKWHVMRSGLDASFIDFVQGRRLSMRASLDDLLDFVDDVLDDLGSRSEIDYLRGLLEDPRGTGADRQIAVYEQTGSTDAVIQLLMQQTMQGIPFETLVKKMVPSFNESSYRNEALCLSL